MNNRERLMAHITEGGSPDRIMTYDYVDNTPMLKAYGGYVPGKNYSFEELIEINARACKGIGLDMTRAVYNPAYHWIHDSVNNFVKFFGADPNEWEVQQSGETGWISKHPFTDLEGLRNHIPERPDKETFLASFIPGMTKILEGFNAYDRLHIGVLDGPLCNAYTYTDMEFFSFLIYDDAELADYLVSCFTDLGVFAAETYQTLPHSVPVHFLGDDCAGSNGPIFSPAYLRDQVLPYWKKIAEPVKRNNGFIMFHTDGRYDPLLPIILEELEAEGLNPIERTGCNDIFEIHERYPDTVYFGNVCCEETLPFGNVYDVEDETLELIDKIGSKGKIFIGSSSEVHEAVPLENIETMYGTVHEYGSLPVDIDRVRSRRSEIAHKRTTRKDIPL